MSVTQRLLGTRFIMTEHLADDVLRGAQAIADYIGLDVRKCFYALERGHVPAIKEGSQWVTTRSRLRAHYNGNVDRASSPEPVARPTINQTSPSGSAPRRRPPR